MTRIGERYGGVIDARDAGADFTMEEVLEWRGFVGGVDADLILAPEGQDHLYELMRAGTPQSRPDSFASKGWVGCGIHGVDE
jgi:hypothetical protein